MNHSDKDIQQFFDSMRRKDEQIEVTPFEQVYPKRTRNNITYLKILPIAASLVLLIGIFLFNEKETISEDAPAILITLSAEDSKSTETLMTEVSTIDSWQAPTHSLINDFNE